MDNTILYLYISVGLLVIIFFRMRSLIFAWLDVLRSFGSKFLVRVKNKTQEYYAAGRIDKDFLYFKGRKRPDNTSPNRMISTSHTWNHDTQKADMPFSINEAIFRFIGVNCIEVDDEKDCIIFYRNGLYHFVPGTNTELFDEHLKTAQSKPSREDGYIDNRKFQIFMLIGLGLVIIGFIYVAYNARLIPHILQGLIDISGKVNDIHATIPKVG